MTRDNQEEKMSVQQRKTSASAKTPAIESLQSRLAAMKPEDVAAPIMPVDRMVAEALALAVASNEHLHELTTAGMDAW